MHPPVRGWKRAHGAPVVAAAVVPSRLRRRPVHLARRRDRADEGGLLRFAPRLIAGLARRTTLADPLVGVFRRRDAREGVSRIREACRRDDRQTWCEA